MPRKVKEEINEVKEKSVKKEPSSKKVTNKRATTKKAISETKTETKKTTSKKTPSKKLEKVVENKIAPKVKTKTTKKENIKKTTTNSKKKNTTEKKSDIKNTDNTKKAESANTKVKKSTSKKIETKNKTSKNKSTTKKATTSKKEPAAKRKQTKKKVEIVEYYDLPYRYNQTIVKILAQTPNTLFVYWDISDDDRKKYIEQYGEYFFNNTKPVLIVHNRTKNYSFEIDINDFANSWYIHSIDSDCDYEIELGRRPINEYVNIPNNYLYVTNSNEMESPNDHIVFDKLSHFVYFKNVKTNETIKKHTNLTLLSKVGKISSVQEFYKKLYPDEAINFDRSDLNNPSSNSPTSSFK